MFLSFILGFQSVNISVIEFHRNYLTSYFQTNTVFLAMFTHRLNSGKIFTKLNRLLAKKKSSKLKNGFKICAICALIFLAENFLVGLLIVFFHEKYCYGKCCANFFNFPAKSLRFWTKTFPLHVLIRFNRFFIY